MLILNLPDLARGEVVVSERIAPDHPIWEGAEIPLDGPVEVDLVASEVGDAVLVRGKVRAKLALECRRCLGPVPAEIDESVDLFFTEVEAGEEEDLEGEVYALPDRGTTLELGGPLREQLILRVPRYVSCAESCRGLCPYCGINLNERSCDCEPPAEPGPWDALKRLDFD
jgi:uncharacterized protein